MFRKIDDFFFVAPQIAVADVARAAADGITLIINNRPDGEDPGAPQGDAIAAAAAQAGISYIAIPVTHAGFSHAQIDALDAALIATHGPVLAYCRSGTRSTYLWALVRARAGESPVLLAEKAAVTGYDLGAIRPLMDALVGAK